MKNHNINNKKVYALSRSVFTKTSNTLMCHRKQIKTQAGVSEQSSDALEELQLLDVNFVLQ